MSELSERVLDLAIAIQQIPAPTFGEARRAQFLERQFMENGCSDVGSDARGNVYARLPGTGTRPPLVVSAHLDTVFPDDTQLAVRKTGDRIFGPGIGDNSLGVAGLLGLCWALQHNGAALPGDVWLVGNTAEEGLGDLSGMRAVVERFQAEPLAYIVLEGMALGQIYHRALHVRRYRVEVKTRGGHSWVDFGRPSAIHELSRLISQLADLPVPKQPRTSYNVGTIQGGTSINTIAPLARMDLDLRSEEAAGLAQLEAILNQLISRANRPDVVVESTVIGSRPGGELPKEHPLVQLAMQVLVEEGIQPKLNIGSTDGNIPLSKGYPAVTVGLTTGRGAHTVDEYIKIAPVQSGLNQLINIVRAVYQKL